MSAAVISLAAAGKSGDCDTRYRRLLGDRAWLRLPPEVRRRFSKRLAPGSQTHYSGEVVCVELSRAGWLLAHIGRLLGGPLPLTHNGLGACMVTVTEDPTLGGQIWSRSYPRPGRFPQVVHSAKRFRGPTGLEEYLGFGFLMRLTMHEEATQLVFRSAGYAIEIAGRSFAVPSWLAPGRCTVIHRAETDKRFSFTLTLDHPWLGRLVHQVAFFEDA